MTNVERGQLRFCNIAAIVLSVLAGIGGMANMQRDSRAKELQARIEKLEATVAGGCTTSPPSTGDAPAADGLGPQIPILRRGQALKPQSIKRPDGSVQVTPSFIGPHTFKSNVIPGRENWDWPRKLETPEGDVWQGQCGDEGPFKKWSHEWRNHFTDQGKPRMI